MKVKICTANVVSVQAVLGNLGEKIYLIYFE